MKVLHIGKFYPPARGGMESHLETLCKRLRDHVNVEVLVSNTTRKTETSFTDGIRVTRVGQFAQLASAPLCPGFSSHIRESDPDLIHLHWPNPTAALALCASGYRGPLVVTYHSDIVRQKMLGKLFAPCLEWLLRRSNAILATSKNYIDSSPVLSKYASLCPVVPLGITDDHFESPCPQTVSGIRERYGDRIVLSVGRLVYYKGFEYLIRSMSSVQGKLLIAGDGPLKQHLLALQRELGLEDKVVFLGSPTEKYLRACYHAARVFALASIARSEAFGIVQVEAMAAGTPVVNTNLSSGVPYVSEHGVTGLTVEPCNAGALSNAISTLLDNDELRRKYGAAARQRAESMFSARTMVEKTLSVYDRVMSGPAREHTPEAAVYSTRSAV